MANNDFVSRVLVIIDPGAIQQQIESALSSQPDFEFIGTLNTPERVAREIGASEPDIILLNQELSGQTTLDMVENLAQQFPDIAIISILYENNPVLIQQAMMAGARSFVVHPFTQVNLLSILRKIADLERRRKQLHSVKEVDTPTLKRPIRTMTVFSPRGGVGCTTLAINLAISLHEETGKRVLLMDGKLSFGHLDVMLNIRSHNTIADLIPHASSMDESLIYDVVVQHVSGIHVLLGPSDLQVSQGIRADDLYSVLSNLQHHFDLIVIDGGSTINENSVTLMDLSDRVFLVSTPDLAALYDARRFSMLSRSLGYGAEKLLIVINRSGMAGGVRTGDIESALQKQVFMQIPDDPERCNRSLNRGIPLTLRYMRSPASKGILELARMVSRLQTAEQVQRSSGEAQARPHMDVLLASSRLG